MSSGSGGTADLALATLQSPPASRVFNADPVGGVHLGRRGRPRWLFLAAASLSAGVDTSANAARRRTSHVGHQRSGFSSAAK